MGRQTKLERLEADLRARQRTIGSLMREYGPQALETMRRSGLPIRWAPRMNSQRKFVVVYWIGDRIPVGVHAEQIETLRPKRRKRTRSA